MNKAWAWIAGILAAGCIIALLASPKPPQHAKGAVYVVVRGASAQQAETKAPEGNWLLVRRIPRP